MKEKIYNFIHYCLLSSFVGLLLSSLVVKLVSLRNDDPARLATIWGLSFFPCWLFSMLIALVLPKPKRLRFDYWIKSILRCILITLATCVVAYASYIVVESLLFTIFLALIVSLSYIALEISTSDYLNNNEIL